MSTSISTPRTDAAQFIQHDMTEAVSADFARALERELAIERARLDWLEENAGDMHRYNSSKYIWFSHQNLRAAIDAAMKEDAP